MKVLEKLMFWRKNGEAQEADPLPDSRPNDAPATDMSKKPDENAHQEDRPSSSASTAEGRFQRKLFEERDRKAETGEPPDSERA
jgi:hypothetical protein